MYSSTEYGELQSIALFEHLIRNEGFGGVNMNEFELNDEYLVFSGIGNHKTFISMIKYYGFNILKEIEFADHYKYLSLIHI